MACCTAVVSLLSMLWGSANSSGHSAGSWQPMTGPLNPGLHADRQWRLRGLGAAIPLMCPAQHLPTHMTFEAGQWVPKHCRCPDSGRSGARRSRVSLCRLPCSTCQRCGSMVTKCSTETELALLPYRLRRPGRRGFFASFASSSLSCCAASFCSSSVSFFRLNLVLTASFGSGGGLLTNRAIACQGTEAHQLKPGSCPSLAKLVVWLEGKKYCAYQRPLQQQPQTTPRQRDGRRHTCSIADQACMGLQYVLHAAAAVALYKAVLCSTALRGSPAVCGWRRWCLG